MNATTQNAVVRTTLPTAHTLGAGAFIPRMALNHDVLAEILYMFDSPCDMLPLLHTCRTLYTMCCTRLLQFGVSLDCAPGQASRKTLSFCDFMLKDIPRRSLHLKQLTFDADSVLDSSTADRLTLVLLNASCLEKLCIYNSEDVVAITSPRFSVVLTNIPNLVDLELHTAGEEICKVLTDMRSPLLRLELAFDDDRPLNDNVVPWLSSFSTTMQNLTLVGAEIRRTGVQYPALRELSLQGCLTSGADEGLDIDPLIRCFPQLDTLKLLDSVNIDDGDDADVRVEEHRLLNRTTQTEIHWQKMDLIVGEVPLIYILAPLNHVRRFDLGLNDPSYVHMMDAIITDATPILLRVTIDIGDERLTVQDVATLFQRRHAGLTHITLSFRVHDSVEDIMDFMEEVPALLQYLPDVTHIVIAATQVLWFTGVNSDSGSDSDSDSELVFEPEVIEQAGHGAVLEPLEPSWLKRMDGPQLAHRLMLASTSLLHIGIRISQEISPVSAFERSKLKFDVVQPEAGEKMVVEVPFTEDMESSVFDSVHPL